MGISLWFKKFESPNLRDEEVFKKKKNKSNRHIPIPAPSSKNNTSSW